MLLPKSFENECCVDLRLDNHGRLKAAVREAADAWKAFCKLSEDQKKRFSYTPDNAVGSGVGYELKKGEGGMDLKEDFHARAKSRGFLMQEARKIGGEAFLFVSAALNVSTHLRPLVQEFARQAARDYGMAGFEMDTVRAQPLWTVRFNHYFPTDDPGAVMAGQHTDKGCFTPHLYESDSGLERLTCEPEPAKRRWEPVSIDPEKTMLFPGLRLQLRSKNRLKATCHRVVANERTAKHGRYSIVAFVDSLNIPYFDKARIGRTQNFHAGFNYDMPFDEFRKMFIEAVPAL